MNGRVCHTPANHVLERSESKFRHELSHFLSKHEEEVDDVLWLTCELLT